MPWKFIVIGYRYCDLCNQSDPYTVNVIPCMSMFDAKRVLQHYVSKYLDTPDTFFRICRIMEV